MKSSSEIRSLTRRQLIWYLDQGIKGDEHLMKEVWEQCENDDHMAAAEDELKEVVAFLRDREERFRP